MKWYAAHITTGIARVDGIGPITVFENVYLIKARDNESALMKADKMKELDRLGIISLEIDGIKTECIFSGVRKIVTISNPEPPQYERQPYDGSEITCFEYEVNSLKDLDSMSAGEAVLVTLVD